MENLKKLLGVSSYYYIPPAYNTTPSRSSSTPELPQLKFQRIFTGIKAAAQIS